MEQSSSKGSDFPFNAHKPATTGCLYPKKSYAFFLRDRYFTVAWCMKSHGPRILSLQHLHIFKAMEAEKKISQKQFCNRCNCLSSVTAAEFKGEKCVMCFSKQLIRPKAFYAICSLQMPCRLNLFQQGIFLSNILWTITRHFTFSSIIWSSLNAYQIEDEHWENKNICLQCLLTILDQNTLKP